MQIYRLLELTSSLYYPQRGNSSRINNRKLTIYPKRDLDKYIPLSLSFSLSRSAAFAVLFACNQSLYFVGCPMKNHRGRNKSRNRVMKDPHARLVADRDGACSRQLLKMRDRLIFFDKRNRIFRNRIFADLTVYIGDRATEVSALIFTALLASMQSWPFRASTVAFPGIRRRLRDDRGANNFCAVRSHSSELGLYLVVVAGLFPNIVAKCGQTCRRR